MGIDIFFITIKLLYIQDYYKCVTIPCVRMGGVSGGIGGGEGGRIWQGKGEVNTSHGVMALAHLKYVMKFNPPSANTWTDSLIITH